MHRIPGLFVTGTDTGVGKTYVAALIARHLAATGRRVGVYKPVASGCRKQGGDVISEDALALWQAAGQPGDLDHVCPQRFVAPLAPHLAAAAEGRPLDESLFAHGIEYWRDRCDVLVVEGVGGLMCPLGEKHYVADLARKLGFPLVVVARNALGTINLTLQTLLAAGVAPPLAVAGVVLNQSPPGSDDPSTASNRRELELRCRSPLLAEVAWQAQDFDRKVDWHCLAR